MDDITSAKPNWLQLESVIPLGGEKEPNVEKITSLSPDSIKRDYANKVVRLSARRLGMKLKHALEIAAGK